MLLTHPFHSKAIKRLLHLQDGMWVQQCMQKLCTRPSPRSCHRHHKAPALRAQRAAPSEQQAARAAMTLDHNDGVHTAFATHSPVPALAAATDVAELLLSGHIG